MPNKTSISWTDRTSNPIYAVDRVTGKRGWFCTKVSEGCGSCYAERLNMRFGNKLAFAQANRERVEWRLNEQEMDAILRLRKPQRIFLGDMGDLFHEDIPDEFIDRVFAVMALAGQHTFQVLTKRPERMRDYMSGSSLGYSGSPDKVPRWVYIEGQAQKLYEELHGADPSAWLSVKLPLPNVWLMVSAENQKAADERVPILMETPAAVRGVSLEPLLGPLDLGAAGALPIYREADTVTEYTSGKSDYIPYKRPGRGWQRFDGSGPYLDWVIVGGESQGPPERRLVERCPVRGYHWYHPDCTGWWPKPEALGWVRDILAQCEAAGVPAWFKQWGPRAGQGTEVDGRLWQEMA